MTPIATPQYADLVTIQFQEGDYASSLISNHALPANSTLMTLTANIPTSTKRYTSVQVGESQHIELGNEFVYMNHSCHPSVALTTSPEKIIITTTRAVEQGGDLTFDYCATEWDMDQPFDCHCKSKQCRKVIQGAKYLSMETLQDIPGINQHILALKRDQLAHDSNKK